METTIHQPSGVELSLRTVLLAFAAVWGVGFASQALSPFLVGSLIQDLRFNASLAGLIQSVELFAAALTSLVLAPRIAHLSKRRLAIAGALIACCMQGASSISASGNALLVLRALSGIGAGLCLASGNSLIASAEEPERLYARMFMIAAIVYCCIFVAMGHIGAAFGARGTYGFEAIWTASMIPILWRMPAAPPTSPESDRGWAGVPLVSTILMSAAILLFEICDVGVWAFSERVGDTVGIVMSDSGWALAGSSAIAIVTAFIASKVGFRYGRAWPTVISLTAFGATCFSILTAPNVRLFLAAVLGYQGVYAFALPFLYGTAGLIDARGRTIVAASGAALIGASIGPYVVGRLSERAGFASVGVLAFASLGVVAGLMLLTQRQIPRARCELVGLVPENDRPYTANGAE